MTNIWTDVRNSFRGMSQSRWRGSCTEAAHLLISKRPGTTEGALRADSACVISRPNFSGDEFSSAAFGRKSANCDVHSPGA